MKQRVLVVLSCSFGLALLLPVVAGAVLCRDPSGEPYPCDDFQFCAYVCGTLGGSCTEPCKQAGVWTTCGAYNGLPANDYDSDGVANAGDNCPCTANANQADCDTDGIGNACDSNNVKWVLQQNLGRCDLDYDTHALYRTVEQYGSKKYVNVCNNAVCYDRYLLSSAKCYYTNSCGYSEGACCDCNYTFAWCIPGVCPTPDCPF